MISNLTEAIADFERVVAGIPEGLDDPKLLELISAQRQFFAVSERAETAGSLLGPAEITELGEQSLALLARIIIRISPRQTEAEVRELQQVVLAMGRWVIQHQGEIKTLEPVVDALAALANRITDQQTLHDLASFMGLVANACSDEIRHDLNMSNPGRPWRILHINRGIVATRSADPDTMRDAFDSLVRAFPKEAAGFFDEGMKEMDKLNYPQHVREVMAAYQLESQQGSLH